MGNRKIELLAPGGDVDSIKAAILAGADAVYCGLDKFNARNRATNISFDILQGILRLAHKNDCEVFLTLNILIVESEMPALLALLNKLVNTSIDGIIVQDLGMFYLLSHYFESLKIHASTQMTTHNEGQIKFLARLGVVRVNLSRELNLTEIKSLTAKGHELNVGAEVFVHGSYCISFSGICYMSSVTCGKSGNRGRCSQLCRDRYQTSDVGKDYPLNLKDNSAFMDLKDLYDAGVTSLKIEGRIKEFEYVYTVVNAYRKQLGNIMEQKSLETDDSDLYRVFNRDFTNAFLKGNISKDMFIDDPMSYSTKRLSEVNDYTSSEQRLKDQGKLYEQKAELRTRVKTELDKMDSEKGALFISVSGKAGVPLKLSMQTPDNLFELYSDMDMVDVGSKDLSRKMIIKKLKALNDTEYYIEQLDFEALDDDVSVPFQELNRIRKKLLSFLNGSKEVQDPVDIPTLKKCPIDSPEPTLSVLISSAKDVPLCDESTARIHFQLPNAFKSESAGLVDLFAQNKKLIPWFPSVLMSEDYEAAVAFLRNTQADFIVTNNSGIAYEAWRMNIPWIAGPHLNIVNSYSLLTLKESFNCKGAYISNELNLEQIKRIKQPEDFKLYYSIYHPNLMMTSRQCLFHQISGCEKNILDNTCIEHCERTSSLTNLKRDTFLIEKSKGTFHRVFDDVHFLNTDILNDLPDFFSGFLIDLRDIETKTRMTLDKSTLIKSFVKLMEGNRGSAEELAQSLHPTSHAQYLKGI